MTVLDTRPARRLPGGLSPGFLALELRRMLRNRRTMLFTLLIPTLFFTIFGLQSNFRTTTFGSGNVTAYVMVSMAVYGAMLATTSGGAMVAVERAHGWSRQLRLTPLRPAAYIATKMIVAMTLGLVSVTVVFVAGGFVGARLPAGAWAGCFALAWLGSLVFAAFGLFVGYLLPSENVMQIVGPVLAALAFGGGLFTPLHGWFATVSKVFPTNGIATLARLPFAGTSAASIVLALLNILVWTAVFAGGAALLFRRDTAR
ncbi:ABC transporter permease [Nocardia sp. alder85J]|uniref:ABC transporter permease n=1 Tax=Nocardia sp. alder85J TaxID=2862949 RepID=UPI001CD314DF|nr:ABC transporter permease [Nocardia sp. alder85J]MCX4097570.1 ABC transporter permease [Nocardia sp. alder85J]